jgi:hypoxanthine-DNA glycosylase
VARADARILVLGSMPGVASLTAQQYYAHPRNLFWNLIGRICGFDSALPYPQRLLQLQQHRLALWDVLASCERRGSLDAAIEHRTAVPNDIPELLRRCRAIDRICCNGGTAYAALRRCFATQRSHDDTGVECFAGVPLLRLPSTSPANASWSAQRKLAAWRAALAPAATAPTPSARSHRPP